LFNAFVKPTQDNFNAKSHFPLEIYDTLEKYKAAKLAELQ